MNKEIILTYLAAIIDSRGFVDITRNHQYRVFFNITEKDLEYWEKVVELFEEIGIEAKRYPKNLEDGRKKGRLREYQIYIGRKEQVVKLLDMIKDYSLKKEYYEKIIEKLLKKSRFQ